MQKNVAGQTFAVFAFNRTNNVPVTGDAANITCQLKKDGGAFAALTTNTPVELGGGLYEFPLTKEETNAKELTFLPVSATTDVQVIGDPSWKFYTTPEGFTEAVIDGRANVVFWNDQPVATPDSNGYPVVTVKNGTGAGEIKLTSGVADANAVQWSNTAIPEVDTPGYPKVTVKGGTGVGEIKLNAGIVSADSVQWLGQPIAPPATPGVPTTAVGANGINEASYASDAANGLFTKAGVLTEGYAAQGAEGTPGQLMYMVLSVLMERANAGTTATFKGLDGTTTSMVGTMTLDGSNKPIAITRSS